MRTRRRVAAAVAGLLATVGLVTVAAQPAAGTDLSTPIKASFAYEWYVEAENWATQYTPALGKYSSDNPTILATHIAQMRWAGLDAGIFTWWGRDTPTDKRFPNILDASAAQGLAVTAYYEPEGKGDPTVAEIQADLVRLSALAQHPAWLRVNGKPVLFVYNANATDLNCGIVDKWRQAAGASWYLQMKVFSGYASCPTQPDSWHQYAPTTSLTKHGVYAQNASPGYWKFNEATPKLARDLNRWRVDLSTMADANVQWKLVTSFNEWGEGSAVEPATQWQTSNGMGEYLTAMRDVFVLGKRYPLPPTTTPTTTTPSSTSTVTPTSSSTPSSTPTSATSEPTPSSTATSEPTSTTPTTTTTMVPPAPVTIAAAGDIACASGSTDGTTSCAQKLVAQKIVDENPVGVLALGDLQYNAGSLTDFKAKYDPSWGRVVARTYPVPGNHEWGTPNAQGYRDYFRGKVPAVVHVDDRTWYSYDLGGWHFIAVDSDCTKVGGCAAGNPQYEWVKADLAANNGKPTIVYWHHPRYTSGTRGDNVVMQPIWDLLYADKDAQLVLSGHEHRYERFAPMGLTGPDPAGLREFIVGTGGTNHICTTPTHAGSELLNCNTFGVLVLTLRPDGYDWRFAAAPNTGTFTDSGTQLLRK